MKRPAILLIVTLLTVTGCEKAQEAAAEKAIESQTGKEVSVDKDGDQMTITTDEGTLTMDAPGAASIPAEFPKDITLPAGYELSNSMNMHLKERGEDVLAISVRSDKSTDQVIAELKAGMAKSGWQNAFGSDNPMQSMLVFERKPEAVMVFVGKEDGTGKTMVTYQYIADANKKQ